MGLRQIIICLIFVLLLGCINTSNSNLNAKTEDSKLQEEIVICNNPYIKVGKDCCLDRNKNYICDADEEKEVKSQTNKELTIGSEIEACESKSEMDDVRICYAALALKYEIPTLCEKAGAFKSSDCYYALAVKHNKKGYCDMAGWNYVSRCEELFGKE